MTDSNEHASFDSTSLEGGGNPCFQCRGRGLVSKKLKNDNPIRKELKQAKWLHVEKSCPLCSGSGTIKRSRRTNNDGSFRKKRIAKSYPSFEAPGPYPLGLDSTNPLLQPGPDEELSYLVGNWKIFQKLNRHRYSTDDICTSYYACEALRQLGYDSPLMLDIGCGLGSVLLSNAWQFPSADCVGIEAQQDRYELALRSVEYNIGNADGGSGCAEGRGMIEVINGDLRATSERVQRVCATHQQAGFDSVTGTPPYFPPTTGAAPGCFESSGCLFELRGGVEDYCQAASKYLRRPRKCSAEGEGDQNSRPSIFTVCNTALASARVYSGCEASGLSVVKRIDVIPKVGKPPLFNVFVIVANEWLDMEQTSAGKRLFPQLQIPTAKHVAPLDTRVCPQEYRVEGSLRGEVVETLTVREASGAHTSAYQNILSFLGKPSSVDREVYLVPRANSTDVRPGDVVNVPAADDVINGA